MTSPLLGEKDWKAPSVFQPEALLREARRQKRLPEMPVPAACLLDPHGDIVAHLTRTGGARPHPGWGCYHTELVVFDLPGVPHPVGAIGRAVGAPFAVLIAEQLFASSCRLLVSVTSAGRIGTDLPAAPHLVLIERALRDEGTSGSLASGCAILATRQTARMPCLGSRRSRSARCVMRSGWPYSG